MKLFQWKKDVRFFILKNWKVDWNLPVKTQLTEWVETHETKLLSRKASKLFIET